MLTYFGINNEYFIGFLRYPNEGVNDMSAHIYWYVFDAISTDARPVHRPIAEVTYYTRFAVR